MAILPALLVMPRHLLKGKSDMSRPYRHRRTYNAGTDGNNAAFVITILLLCSVWTHKAFMLKVEHYALIFGIACSVVVALAVLYKPFKAILSWHRKPNHDAEYMDTMT